MARTLENAPEILSPASITRALINTATAGSALIAKIIAGTNVSITSTGADAGTGDVTIKMSPSAGTLAAPSITLGDAATGLYRPALNSIGISVNGANPFIIDAAGRISTGFGMANIAVGAGALSANTTGINNSAYGFNALTANTSGQFNTAIGANSLTANLGGNSNIAIGTSSLVANVAGSQNVSLGGASLSNLNGSSANNNTAIGYNTALGITTGAGNTIVGANVSGLSSSLTSAVILATGDGTIRADYGKTTASVWTLASPIKSATYTVATLPSAASATAGAMAFVTDALTPTFGATVAAGGAVNTPVYSDGASWKVG